MEEQPQKENRTLVTVTHGLGTTETPENPDRILVYDLGALDILDSVGIEVFGIGRGAKLPEHLSLYENDSYSVVGSLHEPDFEKVYEVQPDLIFIGGRAAAAYEELSKIAPTILITLPGVGYMQTMKDNLEILASIFPDKRKTLAVSLSQIEQQSNEISTYVREQELTALFVMVNAGNLSVFGSGSRFSNIYDMFGFSVSDETIQSSTHGQSSSFEYLLQQDPDYLFVLDRSAATGAQQPGQSAREILDNELVHQMNAWTKDQIIYVDPSSWYVASGGISSTQVMIDDVANGLGL